MDPAITFSVGIALLILLFWYYSTDSEARRRLVGLVLVVLATAASIFEFWPPQEKIQLGIDIAGGSSFLLELTPNPGQPITTQMQENAAEVIRRRVDDLGVAEPVIAPVGENRISVQLPGLDPVKIKDAEERLKRVAKLEFRLVHERTGELAEKVAGGEELVFGWEAKPHKASDTNDPDKTKPDEVPKWMLVKEKADLEGSDIKRAYPQFDGLKGYFVGISFSAEGKEKMAELTRQNPGRLFAIMLDDEVISSPRINEPITQGECIIEGTFTEKEVHDLSSALQNPLQTGIKIVDQRSVSPTLGAASIQSGVFAGLLGLAMTFIFVLVYYRFPGVIANVALVVNIAILLGAMAMFHFVLTLPGIAGIILTIGMAIDANVLIYERLREELAAGKSLKYAVEAAYDKAFSSIFDANVTTLITAVILFWQSSGPVKGFAVTLTIGIIASMFAALIVTRNCFDWAIHLGWVKNISMLNLIKGGGIDFLGKRKMAITISVVAILLSVGVFAVRGKKNFGVDFSGGDLVALSSKKDLAVVDIQKALEPHGLADLPIQEEKAQNLEIITVRAPWEQGSTVEKYILEALPDAGIEFQSIEKVGPVLGKQLAMNSLFALLLGLVGILIYVTARFEFSFAVGAIVALLHDVIITLGVFALFGRELSLIMVGAILTIAGYSINDTIVVFDRIREGLKAGRRGSVATIMNQSINDTLSRTVLTGGTTLASVLALFIFGGPVLNDFAFAMFIGIVVGTYSSIYIAAPVVLWWSRLRGSSLRREVVEGELPPAAPARS